MIAARSSADPTIIRRLHSSGGYVSALIGTHNSLLGPDDSPPPSGVPYPMTFLVEQGPGYVVRPHFHRADQFQVFLAGDGIFGKQPFRRVTIHYAGAHTPYGPIRASAEGFAYLTLRNEWDPGPRYMPAARDELPGTRRARKTHDLVSLEPLSDEALRHLTATAATELASPEDGGPGIWNLRIAANLSTTGPDPHLGAGQFWIVLGGELVHGRSLFPARSCLFVSPDEGRFVAASGAAGLEALVVQFPRRPV